MHAAYGWWCCQRTDLSWTKSRADGKMEPSCPLGTTRCIPQAKFHRKPYNKSFIYQVCSVNMAGCWPRSFFCEFMDLDFVSVHKHAKRNLANVQPSWPLAWSITHTSCWDSPAIKAACLCQPFSWKMAAILRDSAVVVVRTSIYEL